MLLLNPKIRINKEIVIDVTRPVVAYLLTCLFFNIFTFLSIFHGRIAFVLRFINQEVVVDDSMLFDEILIKKSLNHINVHTNLILILFTMCDICK